MSPDRAWRERIYGQYVEATGAGVAPATLEDLAPRRPHLERLVLRHFPQARNAAILDLGCGHGALIHVARSLGYDNIGGVDASPSQVAAARRLGIKGVGEGELFATIRAVPPASLDTAICFDVLEHLDKDEIVALTDAVLAALKPGGRWIVHVPNGASPFAGAALYGDFTHELAFTVESLTQLAFASGFREIECEEDAPIAHGLRSAVRLALWKAFRALMQLYLRAETGVGQPVLTQNFVAVMTK